MRAKLITADSCFGLFPILLKEIDGKTKTLSGKNLIFCEEKLSLSLERAICDEFSGSFNTEVCSFGKFLRKNKNIPMLLSREGATIAVKKITENLPLKCFDKSRSDLAPSLFELISQLKSAKITENDLYFAREKSDGILKNKLSDIGLVFSEYEKYLKKTGFCDQSAALSYLPEIIENGAVRGANVYLFGFSAFTAQIREIISSLLKTADTVTAFLINGENRFAFVNETAESFSAICKKRNIPCTVEKYDGGYSKEGGIIKDNLFRPSALYTEKIRTDRIFCLSAANCFAEAEKVAERIRQTVNNRGVRYKGITVVIPDVKEYKDAIKKAFSDLDVPYFLDEKKKPENYPLISLIYAYLNVFIKGFSLSCFSEFFKNRYVSENKDLNDRFYNYLLKYNLSYERLKTPLDLPATTKEELSEFENFRKYICSFFKTFDVKMLIASVNAREKTEKDSAFLTKINAPEEASVNLQVCDLVLRLLDEISLIAGDILGPAEFKSLFSGGVSAMEVSVIPQYNDAVFVGDFRQAAIYKAEYLFVMGLTGEVPPVMEDVALLSDADINLLSDIKILLEPKIKVVNHRAKENATLGVSAFNKELCLSFPLADLSGKLNSESEILTYIKALFTVNHATKPSGFLTEKQGLKTFAESCGKFVNGEIADFKLPSAYFNAVKSPTLLKIAAESGRKTKVRLGANENLIKSVTSPTHIEAFYRCPYRAFAERVLKAKDRETGEPDSLNIGILIHDVFRRVFERFSEMRDEKEFFAVFDQVKTEILNDKDYVKYLSSAIPRYSLEMIMNECLAYSKKTYDWLKNSEFTTGKGLLEVRFGTEDKKDVRYPPISLLGGKVNLSGVIDRIDVSGDMCRIIDYKTGVVEDGVGHLFAGLKLQLYLYSAAVNDKKTAGAYYVKIKEQYLAEGKDVSSLAVGKTVGDEKVLPLMDKAFSSENASSYIPAEISEKGVKNMISEEDFNYLTRYALIASENAAKEMMDGVIIPSPVKNACSGCKFYAVCKKEENCERDIPSVDEEFIKESVKAYGEQK